MYVVLLMRLLALCRSARLHRFEALPPWLTLSATFLSLFEFTDCFGHSGLSSNNAQSSLTPRLSVNPAKGVFIITDKGGIQHNAPKLDFRRASSAEKSSRALERAASTSTAVGSAALHPQTTLQNDKQRLPTLVVAGASHKKQGGREASPEPSSFFQRVTSVPVTDTEKQKASPKRIPSGVYTGDELKPGVPHGTGLLVTKSGHRFEGSWDNGEMHGRGSCQYYGAVKADNTGDLEFHGQGKHWWKCGGGGGKIVWSYVGEFERGKKNGRGHKTHHIEGWSYEGEWLLDHMTGR